MAGAETTTGRVPPWQAARMKAVARIAEHFNRMREYFFVIPNQKPREKRQPILFPWLYSRDDPQLTGVRDYIGETKKQQFS
jgi:hypothetical protein